MRSLSRADTALVVDSTADLPIGLSGDPNITIVPLTVIFEDESFLDWIELNPERFYQKLAVANRLPKTSQPAPQHWLNLYKQLRQHYKRVYSVHLSEKLSGTYATACVAAEQVDGVTVVSSGCVSGGTALLVERMLARIDRGTSEEEIKSYVEYFRINSTFFFVPTTLTYMHKGGRIGQVAQLLGTLLNINPVLTFRDGESAVFKKTRGVQQALKTMCAGVFERTDSERDIYVRLFHSLNDDLLRQLERLVLGIPHRCVHMLHPSIVGPVIGTHVGPKAVGLCFIQE